MDGNTMAEKLEDMTTQELADDGKRAVVRAFHIALELHRRACKGQNPQEVCDTGRLMRKASDLKDDALCLHGQMGGITVRSGGT